MMNLETLKRWLPTPSVPLIVGALGSAIAWLAQQAGLVILPADASAAVTPLVGLIVAAIAHKPVKKPTSSDDMSKAIASYMTGVVEREVREHPEIVDDLLHKIVEKV